MLDFSRLYCHYHNQQLITNYCSKQQCQIGLCANCICIHTQQHMQKGSMPEYQNIRTTYKNMNDAVINQAQQLECLKIRIDQVQQKAEQKRNKLKQIIKLAKQQTINIIQNFYTQKQQQLFRFMQAQDKKHGLHFQFRLNLLKSNIQKQIINLTSNLQQINAYNFLQSLPRIKMQTLHNAKNFTTQICEQVKQNQCYSTTISYNKSIFNELQQILHKSVIINIGRDPNLINNIVLPLPLKKVAAKSDQSYTQPQQQPQIQVNQPAKQQKQSPALFTLRRPSSQESLSTVGYNEKKEQPFTNVFNYAQNRMQRQRPDQSRATINKISCHQPRQSYQQFLKQNGSKFAFALKQPGENQQYQQKRSSKQNKNMLLDSDLPNFQYTFGSRVNEYNPLSYPKQSNTPYYQKNSLSRISDKVFPSSNQKYNPCFVSDYQGKQINNNIKKMQRKSSLQRKSKKSGIQLLTSFDSDFDISREMSENQKPFMYRTQFL